MTRTRPRFDGSLALKLDFGSAAAAASRRAERSRALHLAPVSGAAKYRLLEHRRRQAQIKARHLLDLMEGN